MGSRFDRNGMLWMLFFLIVVLAIIDVMRPDSWLVDLFSGTRTPEGRLQRAIQRAVDR